MRTKGILVAACVAASVLASVPSAQAAALVEVAPAAQFASSPMQVASPRYDGRQFVVEREGGIRVIKDGVLQPTPFLTVPGIDTDGERGLHSMAFDPDYDVNGRFYVYGNFTAGTELRIVEYRVSANPELADPATARPVVVQPMSASNHNGGQINFGPDGQLYASIGENAVASNSQSLGTILGKVLRFNPSQTSPGVWSVPADNPFPGSPIWALGLRNPFRSSFDSAGRLLIADVGGGQFEEVNVGRPGANFGWPTCEGSCANPAFDNPVYSYPHVSGGYAVIGGAEVRDPALTGLTGRFLFGDINTTALTTINVAAPGGDPQPAGLTIDGAYSLTSVSNDARGCTYVTADGTVYRVAPGAADTPACLLPVPVRPPASNTAPAPRIASRNLRIDRRGRLKVKVSCGTAAACVGTVSIRSKSKLRLRRGAKPRKLVVVKGAYRTIAPGATRTVTLRVRRSSLKLIKQRRKLRSVVSATAKGGRTATRTVTVLAPKRR